MVRGNGFVEAAAALAILLAAVAASADTFKNTRTGEVIKGSLLGTGYEGGREHFLVRKGDGSRVDLSAVDWERTAEPRPVPAKATHSTEPLGPSVCFVQIESALESGRARDEIVLAIGSAGERRPRAVVIEIDTPGGRVDFAQHICRALESVKDSKTVAFIKGGQYQGAFSAGALIAMACEELYIAEGCSIGAAAPFVVHKDGPQFSEKITSAFSATFRALAEKYKRPAAIAGAMVDPDAELREIVVDGKRCFEPSDRAKELADAGGKLGRWVKRKGKPLTLTAGEAKELGIASGVASSREALMAALGLAELKVIDLETGQAIRRALAEDTKVAASLRKQIDAEMRALAAAHPKFAPWTRRRESVRTSIGHIDKCLALHERLLEIVRNQPGLGYDEGELLKEAGWLAAQKLRLMGY